MTRSWQHATRRAGRRAWSLAATTLLVLAVSGCTSEMAVGSLPDGARRDGVVGDTHPVGDGVLTDAFDNDGAFASGGDGNGVLLVDATVSASEERNNASTAADFKSELTVVVTRAGAAVADATVVVTSSVGAATLAHEGQGRYVGEQVGYGRRYQLDVRAGGDRVGNARAEGPTIHTIGSPLEGARHPSGQSLEVRWTAGKAQEVTVETDRMPRETTSDSGRFAIGATFLTVDAGKEEADRVRVRRSTVQALAGGAAGSDFTIRVRNQVEFIVDAK